MTTTEELIASVNKNLELLIQEKAEIREFIFGEGGMADDVKLIKAELVGNAEFKKEGLISMVHKHHELYKKMQNMSSFALTMVTIGGAIGVAGTWLAHKWDKIRALFE